MKTLLALILLSVGGIAHADKFIECAQIVNCKNQICTHMGGENTEELGLNPANPKKDGSYKLTRITFLAASNPQCLYFYAGESLPYIVKDWQHTKPDLEKPYGANWSHYSGTEFYKCANTKCRFKLSQSTQR